MARATVSEPMDEPGVAVKGEDDGLVGREKSVEIAIGKTVRVLTRRLQRHQVYDIDDADLPVRGREVSSA